MSEKERRTLKETEELFEYICAESTSNEEVLKTYKDWADEYDHDLTMDGVCYNGPRCITDAVARVCGDRKDARIIDCAAGTGMVGEELLNAGFTDIDAVDASGEMLRIAETKNVYKNCITSFLGNGTKLPVEEDTYDVATTVGGFVKNHMPPDWIDEVYRIVKPGGYIIMAITDDLLDDYMPHILQFVTDGTMTVFEKKHVDNFWGEEPGNTYVFQKRRK